MALEELTVTGNRPAISTGIDFNLVTFRTQDLIRSCKYAAMFPHVPNIVSEYRDTIRKFSYLTESIEFPGKTLNTVDYRAAGRQKIKVPTFRDFNEVNFTMYYPADIPMYTFFSDWIEEISPTSTTNRYFNEIVANDIILYQYSDKSVSRSKTSYSTPMDDVLKVNLKNCYPISYAPMTCNWADDGFQRVSVTFFYEYSISENSSQNSALGLQEFNPEISLREYAPIILTSQQKAAINL